MAGRLKVITKGFGLMGNKRFDYDERATEFFLYKLEQGKVIASSIFENFYHQIKNIYSFPLQHLDSSQLYKFEAAFAGGWESDKEIGRLVREHLSQGEDSIVVFENANAKKITVEGPNYHSKLFFYESQVFHYLTSADNTELLIEEAQSDSFSLWVNVIVFSKLNSGAIKARQDTDESIISELVMNTEKIIVDAYDFDGFLVCDIAE